MAWVNPQELLLAIHWLHQLGMVETQALLGIPGRLITAAERLDTSRAHREPFSRSITLHT